MDKLNRRILVIAVMSILFAATPTLACMCPYAEAPLKDQVTGAVAGSTAVFVGKVIGSEYREGELFERPGFVRPAKETAMETKLIRFQVERWWKMALPAEVWLITDLSREIMNEEPSTTSVVTSDGQVTVNLKLPRGDGRHK